MKEFVFYKVPDYMSTNVLKNMYFSRILTQVFSEELFFIFYFVSLTYFGQKTVIKRVIVYGLLLLS